MVQVLPGITFFDNDPISQTSERDVEFLKLKKDIDECATGNPCHHTCLNTFGGYKCSCRDGFKLFVRACENFAKESSTFNKRKFIILNKHLSKP